MKIIKYAAVGIFWIALWAIAAAAISSPLLFPGPWTTLCRLARLAVTADFWSSVGLSLLRVALGLICGMTAGLLIAVLTHVSKIARYLLSPAISVIRTTPVASFILLLLLWLGRSWVPAVITALVCLPLIWENVTAGLSHLPLDLMEMARVYRLSGMTRLKRIFVPSVLPYFQAALRSAVGMGWKSGIAAEVLTVPIHSIGKMIYESRLYLETEDLFAWTAAVILLSYVIQRLAGLLVKKAEGRTSHGTHR